ncbi:hypothetical protein [Mixta mediterraneensis]|uniref:hypothetical protein n=1 Tax=Mixta mediterraneensis TaxID=2758443 RepID=UPI0018773D95|nr:hypothetical protein [Mixta mediterraneensis]MBE5254553.1 hypothetical protein [Mixta mediterraneensis]
MESNWEEERAGFIAGEIGEAVIGLVLADEVINRDNIVQYLEGKRKSVGNVVHKGVLRDAAQSVKDGR